jgi:hypothetical protein
MVSKVINYDNIFFYIHGTEWCKKLLLPSTKILKLKMPLHNTSWSKLMSIIQYIFQTTRCIKILCGKFRGTVVCSHLFPICKTQFVSSKNQDLWNCKILVSHLAGTFALLQSEYVNLAYASSEICNPKKLQKIPLLVGYAILQYM